MTVHSAGRVFASLLILHLLAGCAGELEGDPNDYVVTTPNAADASPGAGGSVGSGGASSVADARTPSACDPTPIFEESCANIVCHDSDSPAAGLDLSGANVGPRLLNKPSSDTNCGDRVIIDPATPGNSFILEKLNFMDPQCGDQMPPLGTTLAMDELTCIAEWVESVAAGG